MTAAHARRSKDLNELASGETRRVMVLYKDGAFANQDSVTGEKSGKREKARPGRVHRKFAHMPMASLVVTEA